MRTVDRRHGHRALHGADAQRDERHHRAEVPHLAERDDLDRPHRHGRVAARSSTSSTYRWCVALQRSDREVLEHGIETGIIKRLPHGAYIELHQPLGPVDDHGHPIPLEYQGAPLPKRMNKLGSGGAPGTRQLPVGRPGRRERGADRGRTRRRAQGAHRTARTPGGAARQRLRRTWQRTPLRTSLSGRFRAVHARVRDGSESAGSTRRSPFGGSVAPAVSCSRRR